MNTSILNIRYLLLCLGLSLSITIIHGQQEYQLEFSPIQVKGEKTEVDLLISFNQAGQLGTSNLVFEFDYQSLSNPVLITHHLPNPFYQTPSIKSINGTIVTLNIELLIAGKGLTISTKPIRLATIQFDRYSDFKSPSLNWRNTTAPHTEIFLDDNRTQLIKGKFLDLQPPSAPAKGLVGELAIVSTGIQKQTFVEFESQRSGNYALELVDEKGTLHHSQTYDFRTGKNSVLLSTGFFPAGKYTVRILFDEEERVAEMEFAK